MKPFFYQVTQTWIQANGLPCEGQPLPCQGTSKKKDEKSKENVKENDFLLFKYPMKKY